MKRILYILPLLLFVACQPDRPQGGTQTTFATSFDEGRAIYYGAYYEEEGVPHNVLDLDLLSEGLNYDSVGRIVGSGTNLYFSDIFIENTKQFFPNGTYEADTSATTMTFLSGMDYEGGISGAYLLQITDNQVAKITLVENGSFTLKQDIHGTVTITFDLLLANRKAYSATFKGQLPLYALQPE